MHPCSLPLLHNTIGLRPGEGFALVSRPAACSHKVPGFADTEAVGYRVSGFADIEAEWD